LLHLFVDAPRFDYSRFDLQKHPLAPKVPTVIQTHATRQASKESAWLAMDT
jgi:hypothetical protein